MELKLFFLNKLNLLVYVLFGFMEYLWNIFVVLYYREWVFYNVLCN